MSGNHNLLIVEDEKAISNLIATTLETQNYHYIKAENGAQALMEIVSHKPDIILMDLGLPDMDGVDIIKKVRTWSKVPIIVISARNDDQDKIEALDAGADDYLIKPFSTDELLARIRSMFRRISYVQGQEGKESTVLQNGALTIDLEAAAVAMNGEEIYLSPIEYKLLCVLAKNMGKVLTHQYLINQVWESVEGSEVSSLRVFMASLRKKIEPDRENPRYIHTRIGIGYKMNRTEGEKE